MLGKQHLVFGVATSIAISGALASNGVTAFNTPIYFIGGVALGSLFPDIDDPDSLIGRVVPFLSLRIHKYFGHRGLTHDLKLILLLAIFPILATCFTGNLAFIGFLYGILGHEFLDMMTSLGVPFGGTIRNRFRYVNRISNLSWMHKTHWNILPEALRAFPGDKIKLWVLTILSTGIVFSTITEIGVLLSQYR